MNRRNFLKNSLTIGGVALGGTLFFRESKAAGRYLRPPRALDEEEFLATCARCGKCAQACPNKAIDAFDKSVGPRLAYTPFIRPREQPCMLCMAVAGDYLRCTAVCPTGALEKQKKDLGLVLKSVKMGVAVIDKNLCYSYNNYVCGVCYRACPYPKQAVRIETWERPVVDTNYCVGCGLCEKICIRYPQAIRVERRERASEMNEALRGKQVSRHCVGDGAKSV